MPVFQKEKESFVMGIENIGKKIGAITLKLLMSGYGCGGECGKCALCDNTTAPLKGEEGCVNKAIARSDEIRPCI